MNNIDEELEYMSLTGSIISTISGMEDPPVDVWNIDLEYDKYGSRLAKIHCIDIYFIIKIRNSRITKTFKEVVDNYSCTHNKYSNECFKIIDNAIHLKKKILSNILHFYVKLLFYKLR